ncbi:MAG TPA: hypothetical protein VGQ39_06765 [Pyrinomonadaceae bacterium]|nr:hypothetical protein [Pyrinomonadaceae bacterium]
MKLKTKDLVECCSGLHLENVQSIRAAVSTKLVDLLMSDNLQIVVVIGLSLGWAGIEKLKLIGHSLANAGGSTWKMRLRNPPV